MNNKYRTKNYRRDPHLENIISLLNEKLYDDENELIHDFKTPKFPVIFIIGAPRSGSTLLNQWLASTGLFSYPSNLISRFYKAPYIGALIHKMYVDLDKYGEILGDSKINYQSNLGKTKTPVSPHEFWYFWRRFFSFNEIQILSDEELQKVNTKKFNQELAAVESVFGKPLLLKGMILNWNLNFLDQILPKSFFVYIQRDEIYNMNSLFNARLKFFGDLEEWYSFKPPEYPLLSNRDIYEQLAGQVICTNNAIHKQLHNLKREQWINIDYEEFCKSPEEFFESFLDKMEELGISLNSFYEGPTSFQCTNEITDNLFDKEHAKKALSKIRREFS